MLRYLAPVTSYWGLRDYGTGDWTGGNPDCDHKQQIGASASSGLFGSLAHKSGEVYMPYRDACGKCGARRTDSQLGLEPTPDLYVAAMVAVFREVRRVLKPWGTCWINLGDSYATSPPGANRDTLHRSSGLHGIGSQRYRDTLASGTNQKRNTIVGGLKPKDLCGIPWRVAFALQTDGWYLRSDIIWAKPNPMPESVTDRPTKAHEYVFLLAKSPRYFFDQEAVREPAEWQRWGDQTNGKHEGSESAASWIGSKSKAELRSGRVGRYQERAMYGTGDGTTPRKTLDEASPGRNIRSVWTIPTQPYPQAHFATYPVALAERCILAGTSERGVCPVCGKPWERETNVEYDNPGNRPTNGPRSLEQRHETAGFAQRLERRTTTLGWRPSCGCYDQSGQSYDRNVIPAEAVSIPSVILDPFAGAGTTAVAARKHARRSILIELNEDYCQLIADRLAQQSLLAEATEPLPPLRKHRGLTGGAYNPPGQSPHSNARP